MSTKLCLLLHGALLLSVCSDVSYASEAAAAPSADTTAHDTHAATATASSTVEIFPTDSMEPLNGYCPGQGIVS